MKFKQLAKFLTIGVMLALTGQAWAEGEAAAPALDTPAAPAAPAAGTGDLATKAEAPAPKKAKRSKRSSHSTRHARRRGDGPQDRSEAAKRHQGRMMAQSARRPGAASHHLNRNR